MRLSYNAIRVRYCVTSSRDVIRRSCIARCMSGIVASTAENGGAGSGRGGAARCTATTAAATPNAAAISRATLHPFAAPHERLDGAAVEDAVHVEVRRADHEVDVHDAPVAAGALELVIAQCVTRPQRELVRRPERYVARGVLVEERVVEEKARL